MTKPSAQVLWFKDVAKKDSSLVGSKGMSLSEMTRLGLPTPNGFIVTSAVFTDYLSDKDLEASIQTIIKDEAQDYTAKTQKILKALLRAKTINQLQALVKTAYEHFSVKNSEVAIRPSLIIESGDVHGLRREETLLNVKGVSEIVKSILLYWASFLCESGHIEKEAGIAVIVQAMVQSVVSGVIFTHNPVNNDKSVLVVESILGLGEMIMRGSITPDHFEVDRRTLRIVSKQVVPQEKQLIKIDGSTKTSPVPKAKIHEQKVSDSVIVRVAKLGIKLQEYYKKSQVIEWAYADGRIHIFEAKTLEDIDGSSMHRHGVAIDPTENRQPLLSGACANPGVVVGKVALIKNTHDSNDFKAGSILVTSVISFDQMTILKKASAVITDEGGQTSDAAILCRELGIPCIVGTGKATKILKNNDKITVDATRGLIFAGEKKPQKITISLPAGAESIRDVQTTVYIVVNASEPEMAQMISQRYVDGVGLLQPEFIISEYIGVHPQSLIEKGRRKFFIDKLAEEVSTFCENFGARPILYKLSDLKAYERKALQGGEKFEVDEKNPLLGLHGCAQMLSSEEIVAMELEALKKVREKMGHTNLHVAIPYVRTVDELKEVKSLMAKHGLARRHNFKLYMMAQVPNNVFMLDEYIDVGIDGIFADLTSLHVLTMGIDTENEKVAKGYATKDAGLARVLEIIIKTAKRRGIRSYIGGNLDVVTADTLKKSIEWGVSGISVNPGLEEYMRLVAYDIENQDKKHAKKGSGISLRKLIGL